MGNREWGTGKKEEGKDSGQKREEWLKNKE